MKNEVKGRDIFYGVVAVATLIVAIIGATLAYFSITTSSSEGAVNATAAVVTIDYKDGQQVTAQADELIPASLAVVQASYEKNIANSNVHTIVDEETGEERPMTPEELAENVGNLCVDDENQQVCSVYRFSIRSDVKSEISATLNNEHNGFTYLSYAIYNVTQKKWMELTDGEESLSLTTCDNSNTDTTDDCYTTVGSDKKYSESSPEAVNSIFGKQFVNGEVAYKTDTIEGTQEYDLVLFIKNMDKPQNEDQGKNYRGTIMIDVMTGESGGGKMEGTIDGVNPY